MWEKTAKGKLRHLRQYAHDQRQGHRDRAEGSYAEGYRDAMLNIEHHVSTLLEQLGRGV